MQQTHESSSASPTSRRARRSFSRFLATAKQDASFSGLAWLSGEGRMLKKSLRGQTLVVSLLLLSGCDVAHNAKHDLARLMNSDPFTASRPAAAPTRSGTASAKPVPAPAAAAEPKPDAP